MKQQLKATKPTLLDVNPPEAAARQLLVRLAPEQQRIIRMRFGIDSEDYSVEEVAQVLRISEAEVRTIEYTFRERFRQTREA
jgi:DNA-directed RNA polymerase sigma subunit (sigma70/sigma32)